MSLMGWVLEVMRERRSPSASLLVSTAGHTPSLASAEKPCDGCAHSASHAPWPGHPSGERPCGFCVRNPWDERYCIDEFDKGIWYDGSTAIKTPMDNYIAEDRLMQERVWLNAKDIEP